MQYDEFDILIKNVHGIYKVGYVAIGGTFIPCKNWEQLKNHAKAYCELKFKTPRRRVWTLWPHNYVSCPENIAARAVFE